MDKPAGAPFQTELANDGRGLGSDEATDDLACAFRRAFDNAAEELLDSRSCRDFIQWPSGSFDPGNDRNREGFRHAEGSSVCDRSGRLSQARDRTPIG
jgi:hypothetical protein